METFNWYGRDNNFVQDIITGFFPNKKVGVINWWWLSFEQMKLDNIIEFLKQNDVNFFYSDEIIYNLLLFKTKEVYDFGSLFEVLTDNNVYIILLDQDKSIEDWSKYERVYQTPWFAKYPIYIDKNIQINLDYVPKPYDFNCLLGSEKCYRTIIYNMLKNEDRVYMTYHGYKNFKLKLNHILDHDDIAQTLNSGLDESSRIKSMELITRESGTKVLSHIAPSNIYNNSHFDIVCETFPYKLNHFFTTEKTAKPLATGRFFFWYNSPFIGEYLQSYGFSMKTYDASYDWQTSNVDRLGMMLEQILSIMGNENKIKEIYNVTKNERQHNILVYNDLIGNFKTNIRNWIKRTI